MHKSNDLESSAIAHESCLDVRDMTYCEGKVKSTSNRGVKQSLNPHAYKRSELPFWQ